MSELVGQTLKLPDAFLILSYEYYDMILMICCTVLQFPPLWNDDQNAWFHEPAQHEHRHMMLRAVQTCLIMCWLPTLLNLLKPFITTCTAHALFAIRVFHHLMSLRICFPLFEAKFNVNTPLMNISHLEHCKTHSTHTWTKNSRVMTNYSWMTRQKGW
jgi:uncharacterized protein YhhL (DUF1145 family)